MENTQNKETDDINNTLKDLNKELKQKKEDLIQELSDVNYCEVCMEPDKNLSEFIGDIFYKSMKNLFDASSKLAKSLTGEFLPENRKK
jgi:flagellar motility protein MotE (MotC chaperone)